MSTTVPGTSADLGGIRRRLAPETAKPQHVPLGKALQEYAGARNRERLLSLLMPVQRAADSCKWLKAMVDAGDIFHPLRWMPAEALQLLKDAPVLESAGVVVRMPASWRMNRPVRAQVKATVGSKSPSTLGIDGLLDFKMEVTLDGDTLSAVEIKRLLAHSDGLALIRGKWVEVDHARLSKTLEQFEAVERRASTDGLTFGEAMRMLAGAGITADEAAAPVDASWSETVAGPWLAETLAALRRPDGHLGIAPGRSLNGALRPYQLAGMQWLYLLTRLGLGACLADDMGLGKTIQVLSLLLVLKSEATGKPSLLVAPTSLLANWAAEISRFAPSLAVVVVHPSATSEDLRNGADLLAGRDLVITSYGYLGRVPWLCAAWWRLVVIDEAQAIKNPTAETAKSALGGTFLRPVDLPELRIDSDPDAPPGLIAPILVATAGLDQRLDVRPVEVRAHHPHALAVAPIEFAAALIEMDLFRSVRDASRDNHSAIPAIEIGPLDRTVVEVGDAHIGPIDMTGLRIHDDAVGEMAIDDNRFAVGAVHIHRVNAIAAQFEKE
jgi:SNF2 helicase protein/SNF2 domain-containing protein